MRWYLVVSLFLDSRVRFLLGFIVVAVVVAAVLTFVEILLKKKKVRQAEVSVDDASVDKMWEFLKSDKTAKEKLDFVDETAKGYFKRVYGTPIGVGYSVLIEQFEKKNREEGVAFCKAMFASYYFNKELTDDYVRALGSLFVNVVDRKKRLDGISELPSVFEKIQRFFGGRWEVVKQKRHEIVRQNIVLERKKALGIVKEREGVIARQKKFDVKVVAKKEEVVNRSKRRGTKKRKKRMALEEQARIVMAKKMEIVREKDKEEKVRLERVAAKKLIREKRIKDKEKRREEKRGRKVVVASRGEIKNWVERAVVENYSREKVLSLLNNGKRSLREINRVLNVFDKEVVKLEERNAKEGRSLNSGGGGVASRIVNGGRNHFSEVGVFGV